MKTGGQTKDSETKGRVYTVDLTITDIFAIEISLRIKFALVMLKRHRKKLQ